MKRKDCRSVVLTFLMVKAWTVKKIDCSEISLKSLIVDKRVTNTNLIARFLESGVLVSVGDVHTAIQYFPDTGLDSIKLLLSNCEGADKTYLCQEALKAKKMSFVMYLVEEGASILSDHEVILHELLKIENFDGVKIILKLLSKDTVEKLDLAGLLEANLFLNPDLIAMFIQAGVNPNGKKSPIAAVMGLNHLKLETQVQLVCLLIKCGADFYQLNQTARGNTTPLHVATELSLKIGKYYR